jgi:glycosyltransferase involved in cell wall biosynthesis
MKISYAITVCNELEEVTKLINVLLKQKRSEDEIVVLFDKGGGTAEVWSKLLELKGKPNVVLKSKTFKKHFADWKNILKTLCSGDYIFQIDADEIPHTILLEALPEILKNNPDNEVYLVPRVNTVKGMLTEHIKKWGWRVSNQGWVNWPDYQWRIWKNKPEIKWVNKVHEKLDGFLTYAPLPKSEQYSLYHPKTIERQEKQNKFYETL